MIEEAEKHGIVWKIIPGTQIVTLTYRGIERSYYHQIPSSTTALAKYACNNKKMTSNLLQQAGISVPRGFRVTHEQSDADLAEIFDSLEKPLVVKPGDGTWGENITLSVSTYEQYLEAIAMAFSYSTKKKYTIIVEEMFPGEEYRVLVTRDKVIGVLKRIPANVTGNGTDTIKQLIITKNAEEIRSAEGIKKTHLKIRMDKKLKENLANQALSLDSVVEDGKQIFLRKISNISQGGDAIDYTDKVHPSVNEIALTAIRTIPGLSFTGLDFMSTDITKPQTKDRYVILEINDSPGFDIHDYPYVGKNRHAAREFLYLLFPELKEQTK